MLRLSDERPAPYEDLDGTDEFQTEWPQYYDMPVQCPVCHGEGGDELTDCPACAGTGWEAP